MLAIVLFELRRGQRKPSQWFQDTHENCALWWLGFGIRPSRQLLVRVARAHRGLAWTP